MTTPAELRTHLFDGSLAVTNNPRHRGARPTPEQVVLLGLLSDLGLRQHCLEDDLPDGPALDARVRATLAQNAGLRNSTDPWVVAAWAEVDAWQVLFAVWPSFVGRDLWARETATRVSFAEKTRRALEAAEEAVHAARATTDACDRELAAHAEAMEAALERIRQGTPAS